MTFEIQIIKIQYTNRFANGTKWGWRVKMSVQKAKQAAAEKAISYIKDGMIIGLGTGSTAYFAIQKLGKLVAQGLTVKAVPTSSATERLAREQAIPLLDEFDRVDVTIDGADEVDVCGNLIKGGGGALTREKLVAAASEMEIIIVDESKLVPTLGNFPLPVEVLPFGWPFVQKRLNALDCESTVRTCDEKFFVTDNQNYIIDCEFGVISHPSELASEIKSIPGVVECGLFIELTDLVIVGRADGSAEEKSFR